MCANMLSHAVFANQTKHSDGGATLHRSKGLPNKLDGYNMYDSLTTGTESPRTEVVYNFDSSTTWGSAIRVGEWKLITGQKAQEWFPVPGSASEAELMKKNGVVGTGGYSTSIGGGGGGNSSAVASGTGMSNGNGIAEAGVQCTGSGGQAKCDYLFHIASDPDETTNLFSSEPERVASLLAKLEAFRVAEAPCNTCGSTDPAAEAEAAKTGFWLPWKGDKPTASRMASPPATTAETADGDASDDHHRATTGTGTSTDHHDGSSNTAPNINAGEASSSSSSTPEDDDGDTESDLAAPAVVVLFVLIAIAGSISMAAVYVERRSRTRRDLAGSADAGGEEGRSRERKPLLGSVSL